MWPLPVIEEVSGSVLSLELMIMREGSLSAGDNRSSLSPQGGLTGIPGFPHGSLHEPAAAMFHAGVKCASENAGSAEAVPTTVHSGWPQGTRVCCCLVLALGEPAMGMF